MSTVVERLSQAWNEIHHPTPEHKEEVTPGKGEPMRGKALKRESKGNREVGLAKYRVTETAPDHKSWVKLPRLSSKHTGG